MSDDLSKVEAALKRSMVALDDWLSTYADDMCHPDQVEASRARIAKYGTLGYIADVQQQNREALASAPSDPIAKRMEALVRRMAADWSYMSDGRSFSAEAREILALLPEPEMVDPDLAIAEQIADEALDITSACLAAIRRGRALERDSREG